MTRQPTIDRESVLNEAEALIAEEGPAALTLDALAARAGVSKGGLQYAFKSKEGLISSMVQRIIDQSQVDAEICQAADTPSERMSRWLTATTKLRASGLHQALLAAIVQNPKMLEGVATSYRAQLVKLAGRDIPIERVTALSLAADGLLLSELLGIVKLSPAERKRVVKEIVNLAKDL